MPDISSNAHLRQAWTDVPLTLATADTAMVGNEPNLPPSESALGLNWNLAGVASPTAISALSPPANPAFIMPMPYIPPIPGIRRATPRARRQRGVNRSLGRSRSRSSSPSPSPDQWYVPPRGGFLGVATPYTKDLPFTLFYLPGLVTIPSDALPGAAPQTLTVGQGTPRAEMSWVVAPKVDNRANLNVCTFFVSQHAPLSSALFAGGNRARVGGGRFSRVRRSCRCVHRWRVRVVAPCARAGAE